MKELIGLDLITDANAKKNVMVVHGEHARQLLLGRLIDEKLTNPVIAWEGDPADYDWGPLQRRSIIVWPEKDYSDMATATLTANALRELDCEVRFLTGLPAGPATYCANGMWSRKQLAEAIDRCQTWQPPEVIKQMPPSAEITAGDDESEKERLELVAGLPKPLGMRDTYFVLLDRRGPQIVEYPREALGRRTLMHLAALEDWQKSQYANTTKAGIEIDWDKAANDYVQACIQNGHLSADRVRGLGVYRDGRSIVANLDRSNLWVDHKMLPISEHMSRFVYISQAAEVPYSTSLDAADAQKIAKSIEQLRWQHPFYAKMFTGWLAVAPICGALTWRPNLWLTGPSGCGKTTVLDLVVRPLIGPIAFMTSQSTTEAGIRQENSGRSIPIVWDEFEAETRRDDDKRRAILELVRAATSGDGTIVKGTPGGGSRRFSVRYSFLFASINASLKMRADLTRTFLVELKGQARDAKQKELDAAAFVKWQKEVSAWPENIGRRWIWRSVEQASTILESTKIITKSLLAFTDRRTADLVAPPLAGWYSTQDDRIVTAEEAKELAVEWYDWHLSADSQAADEEETGQHDEKSLVQWLMDSWAKIELDGKMKDVAIRELVRQAVNLGSRSEPHHILIRHGMRLHCEKSKEPTHLMIAATHNKLTWLLRDSPWKSGWNQILKRIHGAVELKPRDFQENGGRKTRSGTAIPLSFCDLEDVE